MKRVIYALFILLLLSSCRSITDSEDLPVEPTLIITPLSTEYSFGSEGGIVIITVENRPGVLGRNLPPTGFGLYPDIYEAETVTITVESNTPDIPKWELQMGFFTNKYGLPPDVYDDEVEIERGGNGLDNHLISLFRTNWFEIERIETDVLVIKVEPNESENVRHLSFLLGFGSLSSAVVIRQSAAE